MYRAVPSLKATAAAFHSRAWVRDSSVLKQAATNTAVPLSKCLGLNDLFLATIGSTIGAGIFVVTGVAARDAAGPAVIISYVLAGVAAFLSGLCYIEYVVETPLTGGAFNYMWLTFGELAAWICACNMILEYTLSTAAVARGFSGYLATLLGHQPDAFMLPLWFLRLDPLALVLVAILCGLLCYGTSESSYINNVITWLNIIVILYVLVAGLPSAKPAYMADFAPFGLRGIFHAASVCFFAFVGFDAVATCAEEASNPAKDLPVAILGGLAVCTALYLAMAAAICLMQPWQSIDLDAPFAAAFLAAAPPSGFKRLLYATSARFVSLGAIAGIITTALITLLGQARIYVALGRARLLPAWLAEVHLGRLTPNNATCLSCLSAGLMAFAVDLEVLAAMVSVGTLATFFMISFGTLWRRYHSAKQPLGPVLAAQLAGIVVCSLGLSVSYTAGAPWPVLLAFALGWLVSTCTLLLQPVQFTPEAYAVPLSPFTPALALLADTHLIGSLGWQAYVRFLVWLMVSLAVYLVYSVHQPQPGKSPPEDGTRLYDQVASDASEVGMTQQSRMSSVSSDREMSSEVALYAVAPPSSPGKALA